MLLKVMFYTRSLSPNAGRVDLLASPGTDLYTQKRIKMTQTTFISNQITCENDVFVSNVALLEMRASIISSPLAPCLHI